MSPSESYLKSLDYFKTRLKKNLKIDNPDLYTKRILHIIKTIDSYNSYLMLSNGYGARILKDLVYKSIEMESFIIEETSLYIRSCFNDQTELNHFIELIATSFSALNVDNSILNHTLVNPLPHYNEAIDSLTANIWLLTILLIKDAIEEKM